MDEDYEIMRLEQPKPLLNKHKAGWEDIHENAIAPAFQDTCRRSEGFMRYVLDNHPEVHTIHRGSITIQMEETTETTGFFRKHTSTERRMTVNDPAYDFER